MVESVLVILFVRRDIKMYVVSAVVGWLVTRLYCGETAGHIELPRAIRG